ncbi:multidrug effflux MFS transporter [Vibrio splendidus]|uniref:multidrug effflux MFS transporter n=1 Tax=Vibrio splendidus TaxID=29497 RepID=UPI000B2445C9|nr:multidrug effflux MFS transporter [Vibrio splendidus]
MNKKPHMGLIIVLLMFPQIVETIYSPVLPHLVDYFGVSMASASQTLSIYFIAFAVGVVFWGRVSDLIGRRKAMLCGLFTYGVGCLLAITATQFDMVMIARVVSAFGAAVGSVIGQTILRDSYEGKELGKVFSLAIVAVSISPVVGLMSGGLIAEYFGHLVVFSLLLVMAFILLIVSAFSLPETKPADTKTVSFIGIFTVMLKDRDIWKSAILVACFNVMMFSYYSLAPFMFSQFGLSSIEFGYSGVILAAASVLGSSMNKRLLVKEWGSQRLIQIAVLISFIGAIQVYFYQDNLWFLLGMAAVVVGFGMASPNIFSTALVNYKHQAGTAGAVLGLLYYCLIGGGLGLAGEIGNLGVVLIGMSLLASTMLMSRD